jgi:hypothetical protein
MTTMTVDSRPATAEPPAHISLRRTVRHGLTLAWRNLAQLRHSPEKLLDTTLMPIVFLVLYKTNLNTVGGGQPVLTGPGFVTADNAQQVLDLTGQGSR